MPAVWVATLRAVVGEDADVELRRLAGDPGFRHRDAAVRAVRYRKAGDVADLVAVHDDPHPCGMVEVLFALAGSQRTWLNWVPMPCETSVKLADEVGGRRARGERVEVQQVLLSVPEPASAVTACRRVVGSLAVQILRFPPPDIRVPLRRGRYAVWRYDGIDAVPAGRDFSWDIAAIERPPACQASPPATVPTRLGSLDTCAEQRIVWSGWHPRPSGIE